MLMTEYSTLLLMTLFIVKHFICDFTRLQSPSMLMNKGTYGHLGGSTHALIHAAVSTIIVFPLYLSQQNLGLFFALAVFEYVVHYHMDWFKMWWTKRKGYTATDHQFWLWFGIDQLVHYLTYIFMVWAWLY